MGFDSLQGEFVTELKVADWPAAAALCERLLTGHPQLTRVRVDVTEHRWARLEAGGRLQGQAFTTGSQERRTAAVTSNGAQTAVVAGIEDLALMRTAGLVPGDGRAGRR